MPVQSIDVILRALNGRRFNQELRAAGKSAQALGRDFDLVGNASSGLAAAGHAASGALYAVSAASRIAAYGVGALTIGVVGLGVQFNSTMEQNELSFKRFVSGGEVGSKEFVKQLIFMAKETPLQLDGIATAARRLFAVQVPENDILKTLKSMADMTAVTGASTDTLLRMSKALGDVHVKGRLMAEEVRQLSNLGVNWRQILDEGGLKLSQKNLENIGKAGISSAEFFDAWYRGSEKVFGGASEEYMDTFAGQWEKLKDNVKIASGFLTENIFSGLKSGLKSINALLDPFVAEFLNDKSGTAAEKLRAKLEGIGKTVGGVLAAGILFVVGGFKLFMDTIRPAEPFFANVLWPLLKGIFKGLVASFVVAIVILKVFFQILGFIGKLMKPFGGVFEFIGQVIAFIFGGSILKAIGLLSKFGFIFGWVGAAAKIFAVPINLVNMLFKATGPLLGGLLHYFSTFGKVVGFLPRLLLGLIGAIGRLATGIGTKLWSVIEGFVVRIAVRLPTAMGNAFHAAAVAAKDAFVAGLRGFGSAVMRAIRTAGSFFVAVGTGITDWLNDHTIFGDEISLGPLGSINIPALAGGGYVTSGGWALVGEKGPELVNLPRSSSVLPNKPAETRSLPSHKMGRPDILNADNSGVSFDPATETRVTKIFIGRRQVAEAIGEEVRHQSARSRGK